VSKCYTLRENYGRPKLLNNYTTDSQILRREVPADVDLIKELHPILGRIYQIRRICSKEDLEYSLKQLLPFHLLSGISKAVEILSLAVQHDKKITVVGDFDADGATSTTLAIKALRLMGVKQVGYLVPNRFKFGYGLTPEIVAVAAERKPDLIITVDNGISSIDGVAAAKKLGIQVIITDHHLPGDRLPEADAFVNPNLPEDSFPSKALAGVGVIFYLMMALRADLREKGRFHATRPEPNLGGLLDLVALGTVADVVPLDHNNRILVTQGLARIRSGMCSPGIEALIKIAGRNQKSLVSMDLGFFVAPRLNAAGRLEDMSLGIECLLEDDYEKALKLASKLHALNLERRKIEQDMSMQAAEFLSKVHLDQEIQIAVGLCLYNEDWHQGVIGILASRIKEKLHRPVIVFANANQEAEDDDLLIKGSARSVPGVHVRDILEAVATKNPELISNFGGHAMAAGLSIYRRNYDSFCREFDREVQTHLTKDQLSHTIYSDGALQAEDYNLGLAEQIQFAGPWGQGFPEPVFDGLFDLLERRVVGESHLKMRLKFPDSQCIVDGIAFNNTDHDWPKSVKQVVLAYKLAVNEFRGARSPQIIIEHIEPVSPNP